MLTLREGRCCQSPDGWYSCLCESVAPELTAWHEQGPGVSASHKSCSPQCPARLCICWPHLIADHESLYGPNTAIPESLVIASLSLILNSSVSIVNFLGWSLYLLSFFGGRNCGEISRNSSVCAASYYILIYTSYLLALVSLTTQIGS